MLIALITFVVCAISLLQLSSQPKVVILHEHDSYALHDTGDYEAAASASLRSSVLNANKITVNTDKIAADMQAAYPELHNVSVVLPLMGHRPIIYADLAQPKLIVANSSGQAYVVDEDGRALVSTSQAGNLDSHDLPTITDKNPTKLSTGAQVLSGETVQFINSVLFQLDQANVKWAQLELPTGSEELVVRLAGKQYYIKFNYHEDNAREQVGAYLAVQKYLSSKGITPGEYVDVRLAGRAYYK